MSTFDIFVGNPLKYAKRITPDKLTEYLQIISDRYYNTSEPIVSDATFDALVDYLEKIDPTNAFLKHVGSPSSESVRLPFHMGSLTKMTPEKNNIDAWKEAYPGPYVISDKLDGESALIFNDKMYTRGNGIFGRDISFMLSYLNIPKLPDGLAIRGELIISKGNFEKLRETMKNPRNAVIGLINAKKQDDRIKLIDFVAYSVLHPHYNTIDQFNVLHSIKMPCVTFKIESDISVDELYKYYVQRRHICPYEIDGIVIINDKWRDVDVLNGRPKYGFAFKAPLSEQITTAKVINVDWNVSRYNYIKPRVRIEPIELMGTTINYATAHNAKFIVENAIGPGAIIEIIRSGDVIPKIVRVIKPSSKPEMPSIQYKWNDSGVDIIAIDRDISSTAEKLLNTFKTLGIKHIGEETALKLVENGYTNIIKVMAGDPNKIKLIIGNKTTANMFNDIRQRLSSASMENLMIGSNCFERGLGIKKMTALLQNIPDIIEHEYEVDKLKVMIISIPGFAENTASKIIDGLPKFKRFFQKLNIIPVLPAPPTPPVSQVQSMNSKFLANVVVTGFRDADISQFIEGNGGKVSDGVTKKTTLLICLDESSTSQKVKKAKEYGIPILTKKEFKQRYHLI